ncbi:MAG: 5-formyltetrahydrofolate cyclo-ligase [Gammaproteobacteria bacterium]
MPHAESAPVDAGALRRAIRARRRALSPAQQRAAARKLARRVAASPQFRKARSLALYIAADGEIDPAPLAQRAWRLGKRVYLPVLHPLYHDRMFFVRWSAGDRLRRNRFRIPEPATWRDRAAPWQLDLVLAPLVAFDRAGNRLGMGGGYYDRTFARERAARWPRRPSLCGLAHRLQAVASLPAAPWDIPLARVFTD